MLELKKENAKKKNDVVTSNRLNIKGQQVFAFLFLQELIHKINFLKLLV